MQGRGHDRSSALGQSSRGQPNWGRAEGTICAVPIPSSPEYLSRFREFRQRPDVLKKNGYIVNHLDSRELSSKMRCSRCSRRVPLKIHDGDDDENEIKDGEDDVVPYPIEPVQPLQPRVPAGPSVGATAQEAIDQLIAKLTVSKTGYLPCRFHDGLLARNKRWTCCKSHVAAKGCKGCKTHKLRLYGRGELERLWRYEMTPKPPGRQQRDVVALDCEMGTTDKAESEVIRISLIDYFTGELLVDRFVWPDLPMRTLNTRYSGVSWRDLEQARDRGVCLMGRDAARAAVLKYVGIDTVIVVHGGSADFSVLRWIHPIVVDTVIVEADRRRAAESAIEAQPKAEPILTGTGSGTNRQQPQAGGLSLKALALERLNRRIQHAAHDSVEDVIATRDLLHWIILATPAPQSRQQENLLDMTW